MLRIEDLIGKVFSHHEILALLTNSDVNPTVDHFAEIETLDFPQNGVSIYLDAARRMITLFLFGYADEDHCQYEGPLPHELSFKNDKIAVHNKLGTPTKSGIEKSTAAPYERYDFEHYWLHIQYAADCLAISMVTLMSPFELANCDKDQPTLG